MAAADTVPRALFERQIVLTRQRVALPRKVVILVNQRDIQSHGTGVAVLAVNAFAIVSAGAKPLMQE